MKVFAHVANKSSLNVLKEKYLFFFLNENWIEERKRKAWRLSSSLINDKKIEDLSINDWVVDRSAGDRGAAECIR